MEFPQKTQTGVAIWSSKPSPRHTSRQKCDSKRYRHLYAHSDPSHGDNLAVHWRVDAPGGVVHSQLSTEGWMLQDVWYTHTHTVLLSSHPVMSDSLRPHRLQHTRPPCPSPSLEVCPSSRPLYRWCHPAVSSFDALSPSALNLSQHRRLFQWLSCLHLMTKIDILLSHKKERECHLQQHRWT